MTPKILLVDDEPNVLKGFKRHLRKRFDLTLAVGGHEALEALNTGGPFAVVVSDMQMPEMSGVELLLKVRERSPQTVRMMLTGNADQKTAVDAVNEGNIFRFLNKPCPPEALAQAIDAGLEQYRLITAEAELLNSTLAGSVQVLTQVLSLAIPEAFGMCQETRRLTTDIATRIGVGPAWQIEMASMLMRLGCVSVPQDLLVRYLRNEPLSDEEADLVGSTPSSGSELIAAIPRLKPVAEIIAKQNAAPTEETPIASRILKAVGDYQRLVVKWTNEMAIEHLSNDPAYDPQVLAALKEVTSEPEDVVEVAVADLKVGMVLESHVEDQEGRVLVAAGNEVHEAMLQKLQVVRQSASGVREPILVRTIRNPSNLEPVNA